MTICSLVLQKEYLGFNKTFVSLPFSLGIQMLQSPRWWAVEQWSPKCLGVCEQDMHYPPSYNPFYIYLWKRDYFVLALHSCDLVLLRQKDSSLVSDCSFKESLEMSEAKIELQEESKAWGKDGATGPHGERSLKTRLKWGRQTPSPKVLDSFLTATASSTHVIIKQDKEQ